MISQVEAVNEIYAQFYETWLSDSQAIVEQGYVPAVYWDDEVPEDVPGVVKYHVHVSEKLLNAEQTTFSNSQGQACFEKDHLVLILIKCPLSDSKKIEKGRKLSELVENSFQGKTTSGKVVFRDVRTTRLTTDGIYSKFLVIVECHYDEMKG